MGRIQFDHLIRAFGTANTRRRTLRGLAAGALATTGVEAAVREFDARRRKNRRGQCGQQYAGCNSATDCCHGLVCKPLENPSVEAEFTGTCAYKRGCGKRNDYCSKNRDCCRTFRCRNKRCKRRKND